MLNNISAILSCRPSDAHDNSKSMMFCPSQQNTKTESKANSLQIEPSRT